MSCVTKFLDRCHIEETSVLYYLPTSELRNKLSWAWFGAVMISPDPSFKIWPKKEKVSKFESKLLIGWSPGWVVIWIQSNSTNRTRRWWWKFHLPNLSWKLCRWRRPCRIGILFNCNDMTSLISESFEVAPKATPITADLPKVPSFSVCYHWLLASCYVFSIVLWAGVGGV